MRLNNDRHNLMEGRRLRLLFIFHWAGTPMCSGSTFYFLFLLTRLKTWNYLKKSEPSWVRIFRLFQCLKTPRPEKRLTFSPNDLNFKPIMTQSFTFTCNTSCNGSTSHEYFLCLFQPRPLFTKFSTVQISRGPKSWPS